MKWIYSLLLVASFLSYRRLNSIVVTLLYLVIAEWGMNQARQPLYDYVKTLEHNEAVVLWSLTWFFFYFFTLVAIQLSHKRLNLSSSRSSLFVVNSLLALMVLQTLRLVDDQFLVTDWIAVLYRFGVPSINVSVGLVLAWVISKEIISDSRVYRHYFNG